MAPSNLNSRVFSIRERDSKASLRRRHRLKPNDNISLGNPYTKSCKGVWDTTPIHTNSVKNIYEACHPPQKAHDNDNGETQLVRMFRPLMDALPCIRPWIFQLLAKPECHLHIYPSTTSESKKDAPQALVCIIIIIIIIVVIQLLQS